MIEVLIASYLGAVAAWILQDAGVSFLTANALAAPVTAVAWTVLARAAREA